MSSTSTAVARESLPNSTTTKLGASKTFTGVSDSVGGFTKVGVAVMANVEIDLTIYQGGNGVFWDKVTTYTIPATTAPEPRTAFECPRVVTALTHRFFYITARNTELVDASFTRIHSQVFNDGYLDSSVDNVLMYGADADEVKHKLLTDENGRLIVNTNGGGSSVVEVSNFPAVQAVSVDNFPAYQPSIEVSNFPAIQQVEGSVSVSNFSPFSGSNTDFVFFPDATNSTSAIYADEQPPTSVSSAGWIYTNTNPQKINWYVYQDATLPQYRVDEMESIYFVITHFASASQFPYIVFTTMPDGVDDAVPNFAKSILTFAFAGVNQPLGQYLFYVGAYPETIRPDIPAGSRFPLTFVAGQSTKTLEQAASERIASANISTSTTALTGEYNFLFQQYGIVWVKTSVFLPVDNDRLLTTETNSGTISTTLTSLNSKITACNTGAVVISTLPAITLSSTTSSITSVRNNTSAVSYISSTLAINQIKSTAGRLSSIKYYNDNTTASPNFLLLYNATIANVSVGTTVPFLVVALNKNDGGQIDFYDLAFSTAITLVVSGESDGSTIPRGTAVFTTSFYY